MKEISIVICDDDKLYLDEQHQIINEVLDTYKVRYRVFTYTSPIQMLDEQDVTQIDILFLDAEMPEMHGLEVAQHMRNHDSEALIIIVTNHSVFMQDAFKVKAFRFLTKPIHKYHIEEVISDGMVELTDNEGLLIDVYFYRFKDIDYIEASGRNEIIRLKDEDVIVGFGLAKLYERLDGRFFLINKSTIVNMGSIVTVNKTSAVLEHRKQKVELKISRRLYKKFLDAYRLYIHKHAWYV